MNVVQKVGQIQRSEKSQRELGRVKVGKTGAWKFDENYIYWFDAPLAGQLKKIVFNSTVLELGAGKGHYTHVLAESATRVDAYDGAEDIEQLTGGAVRQADLTEHLNLGEHDWVVCMEVGEHVPREYEMSVFDNIHRHCSKGVVLSWAVPGQNGNGHVNPRTNGYVEVLMSALGYVHDKESQKILRNAATLKWFKNTLMVFQKLQQ